MGANLRISFSADHMLKTRHVIVKTKTRNNVSLMMAIAKIQHTTDTTSTRNQMHGFWRHKTANAGAMKNTRATCPSTCAQLHAPIQIHRTEASSSGTQTASA